MKVLAFTHLYPSAAEPTLGPFNFQTFEALRQHCEIRLIAPLPWWTRIRTPSTIFRAPTSNAGNIPAIFPAYWSAPRMQALHGKLMYASVRGLALRMHREFPFDIVLATWGYPDVVAGAMIAKRLGVPLVAKVHGSDLNEIAKTPAIRPQVRDALMSAKTTIAVSGALKDRVVELGIPERSVEVVRNAVDGQRFRIRDARAIRRDLGLPVDTRLLCYVGRLSREKGVDLLIDALPRLTGDTRDVELVVVGGGAENDRLQSQAAALGVAEHIRFVGSRPHQEVPAWIAACDLLCLPSRREGCPNVVLEALASGKPVVACNVGGVPELLDKRNGVVVEPESPEAFAAGIRSALDRTWDPQAQRASVEFLTWTDVGDRIFQILQGALGEARNEPLSIRR